MVRTTIKTIEENDFYSAIVFHPGRTGDSLVNINGTEYLKLFKSKEDAIMDANKSLDLIDDNMYFGITITLSGKHRVVDFNETCRLLNTERMPYCIMIKKSQVLNIKTDVYQSEIHAEVTNN